MSTFSIRIGLVSILTFLMASAPKAQFTFERTYDNGSEDIGTSVIALNNGYIMCGATYDDINDDYDVFVTRVDNEGDVVWTNVYTSLGIGDDYASYINAYSTNKFIICGNSFDPGFGDTDAFLLAIDGNGNELWQESYDGGYAGDDGANYVIEDTDGNLLVAGYLSDDFGQYLWLFQTDSNGNFLGETVETLNGEDEASSVVFTEDGGYAICGQSYDNVNGDYDGILVKFDALGNTEWTYFTTGTADEHFNDLIIDEYGDYLLVGAEQDGINGDYDLLVENVGVDGVTIYYSVTHDYLAGDDEAYRTYYNGMNYFLCGSVEDIISDDYDAYLGVFDIETGEISGDVIYGDIYDDEFFDFDFTSDGGYVCVGYQQASLVDMDVYLVKTDENGEQGEITSVETAASSNVRIYPNPANDVVFVSANGINEYALYSIDGKLIQRNRLLNPQIDVSKLTSGSYVLELTGEIGVQREILMVE